MYKIVHIGIKTKLGGFKKGLFNALYHTSSELFTDPLIIPPITKNKTAKIIAFIISPLLKNARIYIGARSSMDRASASEAGDMGSTPVGREYLRAFGA